AAVQLARARLADAHLHRGLAERERVAVVPREKLAPARRQAVEGALDPHPHVLALVGVYPVVIDRPVAIAGLKEHVERERRPVGADLRLGVRRDGARALALAAGVVVEPAQLVKDGPTDPEAGISLERDAARGVIAVDGVDQADERSRLDVVASHQRAGRHAHPARERRRERRVPLDERATRHAVALAAARPSLAGAHADPPSTAVRPVRPYVAGGTLAVAPGALKPHSGLLRIPKRGWTVRARTLLDEV